MNSIVEAVFWKEPERYEGTSTRYRIEGMSCEHCVSSVSDAISSCTGVTSVDVTLKKSLATVFGDPAEWAVEQVVEMAGYKAHKLEDSQMDVCCTGCGK